MPAVTPWYVGAQVPLTPPLNTDTSGNAQDASGGTGTVVFTVTAPDGTITNPPAVHGATGAYTAVYTTTQAGHHIWSLLIPGTTPGSYTDTFEVQAVTDPTIVSQAEAKEILHLTSTTQFDSIIQGYNAAATGWIEYVCGPVVQQTIVETLPVHGTEQILTKPPVLGLVPWTSVPADLAALGITLPSPPSPMIRTKVYGIEYPMTQLHCDNERGIVTHTSGLPFFYAAYRWQYQAGRLVIPAGIYEAAKIVLEHLFMVERGGAGSAPAPGESEGTTMTGFGFAVPNRAVSLLMPYSAATRMVAA